MAPAFDSVTFICSHDPSSGRPRPAPRRGPEELPHDAPFVLDLLEGDDDEAVDVGRPDRRLGDLRSMLEAAVAAAEEEQRPAFVLEREVEDAADDDDVVAAVDHRLDAGLDPAEHVVEDGAPVAGPGFQPTPRTCRRRWRRSCGRSPPGPRPGCSRRTPGRLDAGPRRRGLLGGEQHERRVERHRGSERPDGEARPARRRRWR